MGATYERVQVFGLLLTLLLVVLRVNETIVVDDWAAVLAPLLTIDAVALLTALLHNRNSRTQRASTLELSLMALKLAGETALSQRLGHPGRGPFVAVLAPFFAMFGIAFVVQTRRMFRSRHRFA